MHMPPLETRTDSPWETSEVSQKHVSTGEEYSGSGPHSTEGLGPRHLPVRNPERPSSNSHGDWPFLRSPERVPEVPVVSREHLPQLGKIQAVLPSRRDEARWSVSSTSASPVCFAALPSALRCAPSPLHASTFLLPSFLAENSCSPLRLRTEVPSEAL